MLKTKQIILCALFAALMGVGANVSSFLTIGGVPITLQLLFAILAGGILGSRLGAFSMFAYLFIGLVGAPVFAQFKGGIGAVFSPTFGFIISFIFVSFLVGKCIETWGESRKTYLIAGALAIFANYVIGTNYMYSALLLWAEAPEGFSYLVAWSWMGAYLPLDLVVCIVSFVILRRLNKALGITPVLNKGEVA